MFLLKSYFLVFSTLMLLSVLITTDSLDLVS